MKFTALHMSDAASAASAAGGQSLRLPPLHLGLRLPPRSALHLMTWTTHLPVRHNEALHDNGCISTQ